MKVNEFDRVAQNGEIRRNPSFTIRIVSDMAWFGIYPALT
jgi:hypothetical protein